MAIGAASVQAATTYDFVGSFTFYDATKPTGVLTYTVDTDGDGVKDSIDTSVTGTFTLPDATTPPSGQFTTTNTFNGYTWVADVDTMFFYDTNGPATQTFSYEWMNRVFLPFSTAGACRTGVSLDGCSAFDPAKELITSRIVRGYSFDLTNAGQFAAGVFFDWSTNKDIPVLAIMQITNDPMTDGYMVVQSPDNRVSAINPDPTKPAYQNSPDGNPGARMLVGPFPNQTPAFAGTLTPQAIPVPAAVWLFGSGLLGLVGIARRKKT